MAHFTRAFRDDAPIIEAVFHISIPRRDAMDVANIPRPVLGLALLDTGADCTCVDPSITAALGLEPRGREEVLTPSTGKKHHTATQYDLSVIIPPEEHEDRRRRGAPLFLVLEVLPVIHSELFEFQGIHALIGRDVLQRCILNYNGTAGHFSLAW